MFEVKWEERALKELDNLEEFVARRILKKIEELREHPFSCDVKKLKDYNFLRLRVSDYRVIFKIESNFIQIFKVGHRKNVYKGL